MSAKSKIILRKYFALLAIFLAEGNGSPENDFRKFAFQSDMSEHCKRRVIPSVFLGRGVMDAQSQILHFSHLEVPYSCFITIRTEAGSNIILVIQVDVSAFKSCDQEPDQVTVYPLGETFGGYWGPLPEYKQNKSFQSKIYTIKATTSSYMTNTESSTDSKVIKVKTVPETGSPTSSNKQDSQKHYLEYLVPLVNVSGLNISGLSKDDLINFVKDEDDDVTLRKGLNYETSLMPLLQFSIEDHKPLQRSGNDDSEPLLAVELDSGFVTPDPRLDFSFISRPARRRKTGGYFNRLLRFRNKSSLFQPINSMSMSTSKSKLYMKGRRKEPFNSSTIGSTNAWSYIQMILKSMERETSTSMSTNMSGFHNLSKLLDGLSEPGYNRSYEKTVISKSNASSESSTKSDTKSISVEPMKRITKISTTLNNSLEKPDVQNTTNIYGLQEPKQNVEQKGDSRSPDESDIDSMIQFIKPKPHLITTIPYGTGSLVDHESWDNVVQAAPTVMAVLMNMTASTRDQTDQTPKNTESKEHISINHRKKRHIHPIRIEDAQPHAMTTERPMTTTAEIVYRFSDIQDFAQLVELKDDELYGRLALRKLSDYFGKPLFSLCSSKSHLSQFVFLVNSSRIAIALNNFTLNRMTIITTPARTLIGSEAHCDHAQIECQVSGARVCIDSVTACDGVPNCGAADIYDEDRLNCGVLQIVKKRTIYIASVTFLLMMLTIIYSIHYWLKRCVPKVADAFFIYTNGIENVLYLSSVMRPPEDLSKISRETLFNGSYHEKFDTNEESVSDVCVRYLRKICRCCFKEQKNIQEIYDSFELVEPEPYSNFFDPSKDFDVGTRPWYQSTDVSTQTGDSLEMTPLQYKPQEAQHAPTYQIGQSILTKDRTVGPASGNILLDKPAQRNNRIPERSESLQPVENESELNMLKVLRDFNKARRRMSVKTNRHDVASGNEIELKNTIFDGYDNNDVPCEPSEPGPSEPMRKKLRFDENLSTIINPYPDYDNDDVLDDYLQELHTPVKDLKTFWGEVKNKITSKKK